MTRPEATQTLNDNRITVEENPDGSYRILYDGAYPETYASSKAMLDAFRTQKGAEFTEDESSLEWEWETDARRDQEIAEAIFELYA